MRLYFATVLLTMQMEHLTEALPVVPVGLDVTTDPPEKHVGGYGSGPLRRLCSIQYVNSPYWPLCSAACRISRQTSMTIKPQADVNRTANWPSVRCETSSPGRARLS